jgi:hypothetical protein
LEQGSYWIDANLRRHELAQMSSEYLTNVCDFLRDNAEWFYGQVISDQGDGERIEEWEVMDIDEAAELARRWVVDQELYRALRAELLRAIREGR